MLGNVGLTDSQEVLDIEDALLTLQKRFHDHETRGVGQSLEDLGFDFVIWLERHE